MTTPPAQEGIRPIRLTARVKRNQADAFDLFTTGMSKWWPLDRFSFDTSRSQEVNIEPFAGGRLYERYRDGREHTIGEVLRWDRPASVVFTWRHDDWAAPTEIEVSFVPENATVTRVEVEHRAWDRLGPVGTELREMYGNGWPTVFECFTSAAGPA